MKHLRQNWHLIVSGLLGIVIFLCIFGLEPLRFTGIGWIQHGFGGSDITQHHMGWMFYCSSPWTFPLCKALFLGYPEGTSVSYTDSIPIAALFFKLLSPILPENFQYFGLYTCFCFMMQGIFAAALIPLFTGSKPYAMIGSTFFITASTFLERCFRHTALASHWLILAALLLYFRRRQKRSKSEHIWMALLMCTALGIHPYLFAMVYGLLAVSEAELFFTAGQNRKSALYFVLDTAITLAFGYVLGLFGTEVAPAQGFGMYSLNLNAVFNPNAAHHSRWSAFLSARGIFPSQADGMYYLGLPLLCLAAVCTLTLLFTRPQEMIRIIKKNLWLLLFLGDCTLFAVSNVITFDERILKVIPLPEALVRMFNIFRSSGRFFFLTYYCITLYAIVMLYRLCSVILNHSETKAGAAAAVCCLITAVLQIADIQPGLKELHGFFETRYDYIGLSEEWNALAERYDTARTFDCLTNYSLAFWLAKNDFKTDMMITAAVHMDAYWRRTEAERNRLRSALADGTEPLDPAAIYVISTETGTNRSFASDKELDAYIASVREAYAGRAELKFMTDWVREYWVLCPL